MNEMTLAIALYDSEWIRIENDGDVDAIELLPNNEIWCETHYSTGEYEEGIIDFATYCSIMNYATSTGSVITDMKGLVIEL